VAASTDGAAGSAEQREDDPDNQQDDPDGREDRDVMTLGESAQTCSVKVPTCER
jgi:hypothetical protein